MNEVTLPPSPNWYSSSILECANNGTIAWGSKNSIIIAKAKPNSKQLEFSIIEKAHSDRVSTIAFSPKIEDDEHLLVSGGSNVVNIWNLKSLNVKLKNNKLDEKQKVIAVDWSKHNPNLICFISETGLLVKWKIDYNNSQLISLGKFNATCLACCPHDSNIVSIGCKSGLIYIADICGSGNIKYKLRGHDMEIVSLSWCPVPINIFNEKSTNESLLASGAKDRVIFIWKAGSDGRYEAQLTFPSFPLDSSNYKSKSNSSTGNFIAVKWLTSTLLFSSSPWGELLMWNLDGNTKKKFTPILIHAKHGKGLFSITGLTEQSNEECDNQLENWRTKVNNINAIWTVGQDRQVICYSILKNDPVIEYVIPTHGGFVYCMSACPVDTTQIAIGIGDMTIRLWNLSEPHDSIIEMQILWEKIKGKVRSLCWHPEKENILAFATNEGRVGTFDTNNKKPPIIYRQYHRQVIYRIGWGPAPNINDYALYTCGDGELVYYNPEKCNDVPIPVVKKKECTDFCWKSDYSLLAIGFGDGSISFWNRDLSEYGSTIHSLYKAVQCITWHPESTSSDLNISPMENYLAVCVNGPEIVIFEINTKKNSEECAENESSFYKVVTTLLGHSQKIVCLAWSPHMSGYLVSGSYDCTAQVWKVETQEVIATYTSHVGPVQSCMWSPFSQDLIITGSVDFTLRIWNISNQKAIVQPPPLSKTLIKNRQRTKKKKAAAVAVISNATECESDKVDGQSKKTNNKNEEETAKSLQNTTETENSYKVMKKKKPKKICHFPCYAEITNSNQLWCTSIQNLLTILKENDERSENKLNCNHKEPISNNANETEGISNGESGIKDISNAEKEIKNISNGEIEIENISNKDNGIESISNREKGTDNLKNKENQALGLNKRNYVLFGTKKNLENSLKVERQSLTSNDQHNVVTEIDLWCGNLKENLFNAMNDKRLNEFLVSLAPRVSYETWQIMCEAYANQLIFEENPHKAVSYLLCIDKVVEAIDVFIQEKLFKEAYALALTRLNTEDPIIKTILQLWAKSAQKVGNFQNAVECYIKLGEYVKAANMLERREDFYSLSLAIDVAKMKEDTNLIEVLAQKAILKGLLYCNIEGAKSIIKKCPQMQYREIEVEILNELVTNLASINDEKILNWLKGISQISLLETFRNRFTACPNKYLLLLQKDLLAHTKSDIMVQVSISHELALYVLSDKKKQQIEHVVKTLDLISQFEMKNLKTNCQLLIKYLSILDNKNIDNVNSIFSADESAAAESLRAYLCYAVINWFVQCQLKEDQVPECRNLVINILEKCIADLLSKETVKYMITSNNINKLQEELCLTMGKIQNDQGDDVNNTKDTIETLDKLKQDKKQFLDERISVLNPSDSFSAVLNFIETLPDDEVKKKLNDLAWNIWKS